VRLSIQVIKYVRCSPVFESDVELEPEGKCCKMYWFITVKYCGISTVIFVLFTDSVNNKAVPAVDKQLE